MQAFLKTSPMYASLFDEVWLWSDFPYRKSLGGHDLGIDLVCKTFIERYAYTVDTKTGFVNDPNDWSREHGNPKYIFELLLRIINLSLQTQDIVASLPDFIAKGGRSV